MQADAVTGEGALSLRCEGLESGGPREEEEGEDAAAVVVSTTSKTEKCPPEKCTASLALTTGSLLLAEGCRGGGDGTGVEVPVLLMRVAAVSCARVVV